MVQTISLIARCSDCLKIIMLPTVYPSINRRWLRYIVRTDLPFFVRRSKLKVKTTKDSYYKLGLYAFLNKSGYSHRLKRII